jgi:hypothetical protein
MDETRDLADVLSDGLNMTYGAPNLHKVGDVLYRAEMSPDMESFENLRDYGDVWGDTGWTRDNDYGSVRPDWATGRAEILNHDHGHSLWWEPPTDVVVGTAEHKGLRRNVRDLLEYGFSVATIERCEGTDGYGRPIVRDVASLAGIEPYSDDAYLTSIVSDLLDELDAS